MKEKFSCDNDYHCSHKQCLSEIIPNHMTYVEHTAMKAEAVSNVKDSP